LDVSRRAEPRDSSRGIIPNSITTTKLINKRLTLQPDMEKILCWQT
jgi:hypothetical protein